LRRVLDGFLETAQEHNGFAPVHNAMIIRERDIHHGPDDDLAVYGHGPLLDGMHAEDAGLRRIDDGRGEERTKHAAIGDGEGAALKFGRLQFAFFGAVGEVANGTFDVGEAQALGISQNGNHEAAFAGDGHADVEEVVIDDVGITDLGIDLRELFQGVNGGLHEE
jgi:hypothetical protein